jgi:hypothetical protein
MEQQIVEVKFQGERVGSLSDESTAYTLYCVPNDLYVVHVDEGEESWLETNGGQGLSEGMLGTFFPQLVEAFVGHQVYPHRFGPAAQRRTSPSRQGSFRPRRRGASRSATSSSAS